MDANKIIPVDINQELQKSFIANMSYISKISSYQVVLKDGTVLNASEKYYRQVQATFLQWKGRHL